MSVCLLFITDGRSYAAATLASAAEMLPPLDCAVIVDDTDHAMGFDGAIRAGWEGVLRTNADYVFHLEDDFTFEEPVPLEQMRQVLETKRTLAQIALKRQPWNAEERAAGGIVEQHPDDFQEVRGTWTEHERFFTTNPCLYPRWLCEKGWPEGPESEGRFTIRLRDEGFRFAYWGGKFDPPRVAHIGTERTGVGY